MVWLALTSSPLLPRVNKIGVTQVATSSHDFINATSRAAKRRHDVLSKVHKFSHDDASIVPHRNHTLAERGINPGTTPNVDVAAADTSMTIDNVNDKVNLGTIIYSVGNISPGRRTTSHQYPGIHCITVNKSPEAVTKTQGISCPLIPQNRTSSGMALSHRQASPQVSTTTSISKDVDLRGSSRQPSDKTGSNEFL